MDSKTENRLAVELDLQAMKQAQHAAITSNEKIFPVFAQKLASKDIKDYLGTANKLIRWLGSEKAYYPAARPKIIEMLEIAHGTFADQFVHSEPSTAEVLQQLIRTVVPFQSLFAETELQERLYRVVRLTENLISTSVLPGPSPGSTQPDSVAQYPMPVSVVIPLNQVATVSAKGVPTLPTAALTQPGAIMAPAALPLSGTSAKVKIEPTYALGIEPTSESLPSLATAPAEQSNPPPPPPTSLFPKPQPKRIRKPELSEELKARDLDWFRTKQQYAPPGREPVLSPLSASEVEQSSSPVVDGGTSTSSSSPSRRRKTTARMVPSRYPRRILPPGVTQSSVDSASTSTLLDTVVSSEVAVQEEFPQHTHPLGVQEPADSAPSSTADNAIVAEQTAGQQGSLGNDLPLEVQPPAAVTAAQADDLVAVRTIQQESPKVVPLDVQQPNESFNLMSVDNVVIDEQTADKQPAFRATDDVAPEPQRPAGPAAVPSAADNVSTAEQTTTQPGSSRDNDVAPLEVQRPADHVLIPGPTNGVGQADAQQEVHDQAADTDQPKVVVMAIEDEIRRSEQISFPPVAPVYVTMEFGERQCSPVTNLHAEEPPRLESPTEGASSAVAEHSHFEALPTKPAPMEVDPPETSVVAPTDRSIAPLSPEPGEVEATPALQRPCDQVLEGPNATLVSPSAPHQGRDTTPSISTDIVGAPLPQIEPETCPQDAGTRNGRFGGMMIVIHGLQGKPYSCTHNIEFHLEDALFASVSRWVNRKTFPSQVSQSVCISLACYRLPELFMTSQSDSRLQGIVALTSHSSCSWPTLNRLFLQIECKGKHHVISLSPPIILTPEKCVDISSLLTPGHNTFRITQEGDLSEFALIIHAHHPSEAQLTELSAVVTANQQWKNFIKVLGSPIRTQSPWQSLASTSPALHF